MLDSFLSDFHLIRDTLDKESDPSFFGKEFSLFEADPVIFYNAVDDRIVYMNEKFANEFKFSVGDLAKLNYSLYALLSHEDKTYFRKVMSGIGANPDVVGDETFKLVSKDNKTGCYQVKTRRLQGAYYWLELKNVLNNAVNILDHKTAGQLVGEAENILKFGFWVWEISENRTQWTKGMYQIFGVDDSSPEAPVNSFDSPFTIHDEAFVDFEKRFRNGEIRNTYSVRYRARNTAGAELVVCEHGRIEYLPDGKPSRIIGLTQDITKQEDIIKNLSDYKAMMEDNEAFLKYGTWESDGAGKNIKWTNGMYGIFGYDEADRDHLVINTDLYNSHMLSPEDRKDITEVEQFLNGQSHYFREMEIKDKHNAVKLLSTYAKVIRDSEGKVSRIIGTTRDVTEIKENERMLENKISELNRSNKDLEEFAYVASHDLQEPLRKISTFIQRLQHKVGEMLDEDAKMYISRIMASADNMRNLIENLLEFSRISRNQQPMEMTSLADVLSEVLSELDMAIEEAGATVTAEGLPTLEASPSQMSQLFHNLISNALKFRKKDVAPVITIASRNLTREEKKQHQLQPSGEYVMITVADNGIGFEDKFADRIFQLFQRLHGKYEYPGTGIGLSICKKIVTNHHGIMYAKGEPGKGSVFYIILPIQ